ncbi:MAG: hypothetical protein GXP26_05955 [Planctomycetes bacterium]|nr:hypothetical protein [Planctomycetota bacterium]
MNFALLGTDRESLLLAQAALAAGHEIVWCGDLAGSEDSSALLQELLGSDAEDLGDQWEALYDLDACDAMIVGRGAAPGDLRADQINQLVKNGVAVLATFPVVDSVLAFYEIDMARNESGAVLHHYNPLVEQQQIIRECADWVREQHPRLGAIEQIVWHRPLANRTREQTLWHFARDVELLGQMAGRLDRLGALGSPDEQATYAGLSVQLLGDSKVPVRWEVGPVEKSAWARLTLVAEQGTLTVEFNEQGCAMQMETNHAGQSQATPLEATQAASVALNSFVAAVESKNGQSTTWLSALHAMELADTIEISLRRGRMIDVHQQQLTEQLAFKGTMSAIGCGVLMVLPPLLLLGGWLAGLAGLPIANYWPHALLVLLVAFLVFQLLPKLLLGSPDKSGSSD